MHPSPTPLRVLAVDDWVDTAESLGMLLQLWGHEVRIARDGQSAVETAAAFQPQVVLMDLGLGGGLNGYEVARRLRRDLGLRRALLVCLSGHGDDSYRRRARDAGFDHFLLKPADPEHLRQLLSAFHALWIAAPPDENSP